MALFFDLSTNMIFKKLSHYSFTSPTVRILTVHAIGNVNDNDGDVQDCEKDAYQCSTIRPFKLKK